MTGNGGGRRHVGGGDTHDASTEKEDQERSEAGDQRLGDAGRRESLPGDAEHRRDEVGVERRPEERLAGEPWFAAGDLRADFDGDGALTFFDFLAFQNEFAAGCP